MERRMHRYKNIMEAVNIPQIRQTVIQIFCKAREKQKTLGLAWPEPGVKPWLRSGRRLANHEPRPEPRVSQGSWPHGSQGPRVIPGSWRSPGHIPLQKVPKNLLKEILLKFCCPCDRDVLSCLRIHWPQIPGFCGVNPPASKCLDSTVSAPATDSPDFKDFAASNHLPRLA